MKCHLLLLLGFKVFLVRIETLVDSRFTMIKD